MSEQAGQLQPSRGSNARIPEGDLVSVLASRVESLVERFRAAKLRIADLDAQIAELTRAQQRSKRRSSDAQKRLERVIAQVARLEDGGA